MSCFSFIFSRAGRSSRLLCGAVVLMLGAWPVAAQQAQDPTFEKTSLAWRTSLHFDPGAEAPLRSLINVYQNAGRMADLAALYISHVTQFPNDEGAKVVLARLYLETKDPRAEEFIALATKAHPQNALLTYVKSLWLESKFDPRALETLDQAIGLETVAARRSTWLAALLKGAATSHREDLLTARLAALVKENALTPAQRIQWTRRALDLGLTKSARTLLKGADLSSLQGDEAVDAHFVQARAALAANETAEAARHAGDLLKVLAPDHWRRKEALQLRWQAADETQRAALLEESSLAYEAAPGSDAGALAHGDLLVAAGRKDDALEVWRETLRKVPASRLLEERILDLLETLHRDDSVLAFLADRVQQQPEREDLALRRARSLLLLGRVEQGATALDELLAKAAPAQRAATLVQTARWLRSRNLFAEGARILESVVVQQTTNWEARKELAEVYALLKRREDMQHLFDAEMPDEVPQEVRLEIVQFLIGQRLWTQARRCLEKWIQAHPADFDSRLLLAKVCSLSGDTNAASKLLNECRSLTDTDARHAAWLSAAWEDAETAGTTSALIQAERKRLWPKDGKPWDAAGLTKLSQLAQQTAQAKEQTDAEKLLRAALDSPGLPPAQSHELRLQLIAILDAQPKREKDIETQINAALDEPGAAKGDLQLRLALMYHSSKRPDLARSSISSVKAEECSEIPLISRAAAVGLELGLDDQTARFYARLIQLQPEERAHWLNWTARLVETGDEEMLRAALREMRAHAPAWNLTEDSQELLRRHLAASCWRSVTQGLANGELTIDTLQPVLDELERIEMLPQRRLWASWVHGVVALRDHDASALAEARRTLETTSDAWLDFPDGLSLSVPEALNQLSETGAVQPSPSEEAPVPSAPAAPFSLGWTFTPPERTDLQRWDLTPDGRHVVILDSRRQIYCLDRQTGKQLWTLRIPGVRGRSQSTPIVSWNPRNNGGEQISLADEWAVDDRSLCVMDESGITCLDLTHGDILWQAPGRSAGLGSISLHEGRLLWWQVQTATLDAFDSVTGRLAWSRKIQPLSEAPLPNPYNPQWFATGIHADAGRALVWGNGTCVVRVADGEVLWKASSGRAPVSFPLELRANDESVAAASTTLSPMARGLQGTAAYSSASSTLSTRNIRRSSNAARIVFANPLATPSYGYPGMYGGPPTTPWISWGADGLRCLRGDGVWMIGQSVRFAAYSVLGLPVSTAPRTGGGRTRFSAYGQAVGFVGQSLILCGESGVTKITPGGVSSYLLSISNNDNSPARNAMVTAALSGRTVLVATRDRLQIQDALSGTVTWEGEWPEQTRAIVDEARKSLDSWQSLRFSQRGLFLYDGQGRTLTLDWRSLTAGRDWIIPAGTRALVCLRGQ